MRALKAAVIIMGVLIAVGVVTLVAAIFQRVGGLGGGATAAAAILDEPAGTRIASSTASGDRLALTLQGGGPDRVVVLDLRTGRPLGRVGLAR